MYQCPCSNVLMYLKKSLTFYAFVQVLVGAVFRKMF